MNSAPKRMAFNGASTSRLYRDFYNPNVSPDFEGRGVRRLMRARARQLVNDNSYANGFVNELKNNVVGPKGIRLKAKITTLADEFHKKTNDAIEAAWDDWGLPENASVDGHDSWLDLQRLILGTIAVDGECFVRRRMYYDNPHGYSLQIIDADQVDDFYTRLPTPGQNEIRGGVELDQDLRPVAYHVWTRQLSDGGERLRQRVPASEIKHLFIRYRANQTRGITWFAPVLTSIKMHDGYTEAELVAARTGAAKMGFIVTKNPEMGGPDFDENDPTDQRMMEASPGMLEELGPGQEVQMFDPNHPSVAFKDFTMVILRGVARGLGISYHALTGDLTGANYSSLRAGLLPERDHWRSLQEWLSVQLHRRVYNDWVSMALLTGALSVDSRIANDFKSVAWKARGFPWIDPLKDMQSRILGIQHGIDSRHQAMDDEGGDLEDTMDDLQLEQEMAEERGIDITPVAPPIANKPFGQPSQTDKEEAQQEDGPSKQEDKQPSARALMRVG